MKINIKDKKVIASIIGAITGIALIGGFMLYGSVNMAENDLSGIVSSVMNIQDNVKLEKSLLLEVNDKMKKVDSQEMGSTDLELAIKLVDNLNPRDNTQMKKNIETLDKFNNELDKVIEIYEGNDQMKQDVSIANDIEKMGYLNSLIDDIMSDFNLVYAPSFNKAINKFPVNIVANTKDWSTIDKFTSINQ